MKSKYIIYKVQDYNNSAHPVTCEDQHLTRMFNTLTWSQFVLMCLSQANSGVIGHVCCHLNWAPTNPTVEWSVMSVVIRIEPLPSQQWSDRSCLLSFELSPSKPTVEWSVMSVVIRIEPLPSQQWSDRSCLLSFELSPSQANSGVMGHVYCPSNYCFCLPLGHFQVQ